MRTLAFAAAAVLCACFADVDLDGPPPAVQPDSGIDANVAPDAGLPLPDARMVILPDAGPDAGAIPVDGAPIDGP